MILKAANLLYLIDFDGTIAGSDDWHGFFKNCQLSLRQLHFNPHDFDIRWCILTSRPKIDRWFIKTVCKRFKLKPKQIITGPTFTWKFKNLKQEVKYKEQIIKSILEGKFDIDYTDVQIQKVCYIDNNDEVVKMLNDVRGEYRYLAMSVADFVNRDYVQLLS
jgi:hypothetical protein